MRECFLTKNTLWVRLRLVLLLQLLLLVFVILTEAHSKIAKPGCQDECGGVQIPFPFGIGHGCYFTGAICYGTYDGYCEDGDPIEGFEILCNGTANNRKPLIPYLGNREVLSIDLHDQTLRVSWEVAYDCVNIEEFVPSSNPNVSYGSPHDARTTLWMSSSRNRLTTIGCDVVASLGPDFDEDSLAQCNSSCMVSLPRNGVCNGCCDASISSYDSNLIVPVIRATRLSNNFDPNIEGSGTCGYAFVAENGWYNFSATNLSASAKECYNFRVPLVFNWDWNLETFDCADVTYDSRKTPCSSNSMVNCSNLLMCQCLEGYNGNSYLPNGCQDVNECIEEEWMNTTCQKREYCVNKEGGYHCRCPFGYVGNGTTTNPCIAIPAPVPALIPTTGYTKLIVGVCVGLGSMICSVALYVLHKLIKRRKEIKEKEHNFKRNGGLLLEQQISTNEGCIDRTKIFTRIELEKATNNFNDNRVLGRGGQGTVYKGMLVDGTIVAVKKSKKVDDNQLAPFINEVVILSQINHRNVVKLFGCCLETHVPLLVYEFVPNGTLYQHIHNPSEDFPMTWKVRLQIAMECAKAIAYLHSSCSSPIYHRDIKSSNILLDEKYKAKVSDFGTSRTISIDKTHVTTNVQGTFGYLDPEFFRSSQFNEKSDVYSFGVVLLELLTSMKPIFSNSFGEPRGLAIEFIQIMETHPNQLHDILDAQVLQHCSEEELHQLTKLIERCLSVIGKQRPTMTEVAMTLEMIKSQQDKEANHVVEEERHIWIEESSSTNEDSSIDSSIELPR